ncbi:PREDICTED: interferon-induced, double-stranded RNA-activated protein kinase-like [Amphimedon queenslandica]|uniref:Protein kinase domain-containing protein n=1 Tax=Amphimedon queenslandica TaxID=400682 RepID=A0A1X7VUF7_AMPQE|nr:PREDICTED: interferon-induced, double-stranded RNA-activated protein kinase-like [Amphimedon queenslandica]|eukprot:XP_011403517.1 PREDICTED: interferon-induced, double-stranded RNA-activated protein kinase-like [Amphimedon queenslandica]
MAKQETCSNGSNGSISSYAPHLLNRWAAKDGHYSYEKVLHEGTYGTTLLARRGKFGPRLAILLFHLPWANTVREVHLKKLSGLRHKNLVHLIDCYDCHDPPLTTMSMTQFPSKSLPPPTAVAVVMELSLSGTLSKYLNKYRVNEETRLRWYNDLAMGLHYLHSNGILHWDLRPENIFIQDDQLRLANIGFMQTAKESNRKKFNFNHSVFLEEYVEEAIPFIAPETFGGVYNKSSEIFSLGLIFLAIAESPDCGYHKARWSNTTDVLGKLLHSRLPPRTTKPVHLLEPPVTQARPQESSLFNEMLSHNPHSRPTTEGVLTSLEGITLGGKETLTSMAVKWICSC